MRKLSLLKRRRSELFEMERFCATTIKKSLIFEWKVNCFVKMNLGGKAGRFRRIFGLIEKWVGRARRLERLVVVWAGFPQPHLRLVASYISDLGHWNFEIASVRIHLTSSHRLLFDIRNVYH